MSLRKVLIDRLEKIEADMERARASERAWTSVGTMHRQANALEREIAKLAEEEDGGDLSLADEIAAVTDVVLTCEDRVAAAIEAALKARRDQNIHIQAPERT